MNIGDALTACGFELNDPDGHIVIVRLNNGKPVQRPVQDVAHLELVTDTYSSGGIFRNGSRAAVDLVRVLEIQLDADLSDYLGWPKPAVHDLDDPDLWPLIELQRADLEELFERAKLPVTRLDYTGYGLCAHIMLDDASGREISRVKAAHKGIIQRINDLAGRRMLDPQVSDSGTRITRIPGCLNTKAAIHRQTRTIWSTGEIVGIAQLEAVAGQAERKPARVTPIGGGKRIDDRIADDLIKHVAPHWTLGQKHIASLALAGILAKSGVAQEQASEIVGRISEAAGDTDRDDRLQSVVDTYKRVEQGLETRGFYGLRDLLPAELTVWIDRELGKVRGATAGNVVVEFGGEDREVKKPGTPLYEDFTPAPDAAFFGWTRDYLDVMEPTTEAPSAFHLGCSLTLAGAVFGRRVSMLYGADPLYPNLYTLLIGRSGKSRKDTSIKRVTRILTTSTMRQGSMHIPDTKVATDVASAEGLVNVLSEKPNLLLYLTEFSKLMGNSRRKGTSTILSTLIEAWDTPPVMENLNKASPVEARYPYLSILSAVQPKMLADLMSEGEIHSGFANRWFYIGGSGSGPKPISAALSKEAAADLYLELVHAVQHFPQGTTLSLDPDAKARWDAWYIADYNHESDTEEEDAMRQRHATLIQKIALIYAILDRSPAITLRHLEPAITIIEWMWTHVRKLMGTWGAGIDSKIETRIEAVLIQRGTIKRRELAQYSKGRQWGIRDFNAVLDAMQRNGSVLIDPAGHVMLPGEDE